MSEERLLNPVQVRYSDDGSYIYVSVNPREVINHTLTAEEILEALIETGFSSFEYQLEQDVLDEMTHLPWNRLNRVIIRRIAYRVEFDLKVTLSPDRMHAFVSIKPAYSQEQITRERLIERLSHSGVKAGLIEEAVKLLVTLGDAVQIEVARGQEPEHGRDSWLEFMCPVLDLKEIPIVEPGTPLVRKHPPTSGVDGYKISGQPIPAIPGQNLNLNPGEGCDLAPKDSNLLLATVRGIPILTGQHIRVDPLSEIQATDPLQPFYLHSLLIRGPLPEHVRLRCAGHLIVDGPVSGGELIAEGDLVLRQPVSGPVWLQSAGDMHLHSASHALIHCGHVLRLERELFHCQSFVAGELQGASASISGGALHCLDTLVLAELGSAREDPTLLQLGASNYFLERLYSLQAEGQDLKKQLEEVLRQLIRQRSHSGDSPESQALQHQQRALLYRDLSLRAEMEVLSRAMDPDARAEAVILKRMHPQVTLCWHEESQLITLSRLGVRLKCEPGKQPEFLDLEGQPAQALAGSAIAP